MKRLPRLIGPTLGVLVLAVSALAGWSFATALIGGAVGLLAGTAAGLLIAQRKEEE
jgi:hypothetical protein